MANEGRDIVDEFEAEVKKMHLDVYSTNQAKARWFLVDISLSILHNLAKATTSWEKFKGSDTRRILDIYKGADSKLRRLLSCLVLSYVIDPETEIEMIKDDSDIIDQILEMLKSEKARTGYSLQELLEGLENLTLHPQNKEKILSEGVPVLLDLYDAFKDDDKFLVLGTLAKLGLFLEADGKTSAGDNHQELEKDLQEDIMFVESLLASLEEFDTCNSSDVQDVMKALVEAVSKHCRVNRRFIVDKAVTKNIAESLMTFFTKLYNDGDTTLYENGDKFGALHASAILLLNYSDVSVSFADAMANAGLVSFLLDICDRHHCHLVQMRDRLKDIERMLRGKVPEHLENLVEDGNGEVACRENVADSDLEETEEISADNMDSTSERFRFKPMGIRAGIKHGGKVAYRMDAEIDSFNNKAVFVTDKPLQDNQMFEIKIDKFNQKLANSLAMGASIYSEFPRDVVYFGDGHGIGTGFWILRSGEFWRDFIHSGSSYSLNFETVGKDDRIGIARRPNGTLHFFLNGEHKGVAFKSVPECLYPVVAVTGKCLQVSIVDNPSPMEISSETEDKTLKPIEHFFVDAAFGGMQTFRRSRAPHGMDFEYEPGPKPEKEDDSVKKMRDDNRKAQECSHEIYFKLDSLQETLAQLKKRDREKGYMVERDLLFLIEMRIGLIMQIIKCGLERDPVSTEPYLFIEMVLRIQGILLNAYHRNVAPEDPSKLTGRLETIFKFVVEGCFGNIRNLDGYIWTGSTSEGFALTDHTEGSEAYLDDEMDVMIPIGTIAEGPNVGDEHSQPSYEISEPESDQSTDSAGPRTRSSREVKVRLDQGQAPSLRAHGVKNTDHNATSSSTVDEKQVPQDVDEGDATQGRAGQKPDSIDDERSTGKSSPLQKVEQDQRDKTSEESDEVAETDHKDNNYSPQNEVKSENSVLATVDKGPAGSAARKKRPKGPEVFISELEDVGTRQSHDSPLIWVQTSLPGYVNVQIPTEKENLFSNGLLENLCTTRTETGTENIYLSRSKLLKVQEDFVRSEIPCVQYCLDIVPPVWGENRGTLALEQQGPVQTLHLHQSLKSREALKGGNYTTAEFDQTIDVALVLSCTSWPSQAEEWISRERQWPSRDVVQRILTEGCHVVPKAYPGSEGDDELQWRLSFSLAERTLANTFMPWQRTTYLVLKKLWRRNLKEPKVISSYHMKTAMYWVSEQIPPHKWQEGNLGRYYLDVLSKLIEFLDKRTVPNFFLPHNNMVSHLPETDIETILQKLRDIRKNPRRYLQHLVTPSNTFTVFSEEAQEPSIETEYGQHAMYRKMFNDYFFKVTEPSRGPPPHMRKKFR